MLGDYHHSEDFGDIEGWDLQHYRPVSWLAAVEQNFQALEFPRNRFTACKRDAIARWVSQVVAGQTLTAPSTLRRQPPRVRRLDVDHLEDKGLREAIEEGTEFHRRIWGGDFGVVPTEAELVTHVTVPLLEAHRWRSDQIAIGWNYTDVAVFPMSNENHPVADSSSKRSASETGSDSPGGRPIGTRRNEV